LAECQKQGKQTVLIDLSMFEERELADYSSFLTLLAEELWQKSGATPSAQPSSISSQSIFIRYLERKLLPATPGQIVFAFDEIDKLLGKSYCSDFAAMLRYYHDHRSDPQPTPWARLEQALVHSTEPHLLIKSPYQSPFNVGTIFELQPFNRSECEELNRRFESPLGDEGVTRLMDLLNGHPFLTQTAFYHLAGQPALDLTQLERQATDRRGPFGVHLRAMEHKLADEAGPEMLKAMKQLASPGAPQPRRETAHRLQAAGLAREAGALLVPANQLYARFFGNL
jgi:hypothetical protein